MSNQRYYGLAAFTHTYSNYEGVMWNVLDDTKEGSLMLWKNLTSNSTDVEVQRSIVTNKEAPLLKFIEDNMDSWAQDPNMFSNNFVMIQTLRTDFCTQHKDANKGAWDKIVSKMSKKIEKYHQ
jgi:hypothetical protein